VPDPRPAAAFVLDHYSRSLFGGYADIQDFFGEQTARDDLVTTLNHMDAAVVALGEEVEPRVRSDLRDAIQGVKERARRQDDFQPRLADRMVLTSEADRALAPQTGLRRLYDFGTALGRYEYAARAWQYGEPPPDFAEVLAGARRVLADGAAKVPVLERLVSAATEPKAIGVRKLLCRALSEPRDEAGTDPEEWGCSRVLELLGRLHGLLVGQLSELTRTEAPSGANGHGDEKPVWDAELSTLSWRGEVIRQFRAPARNQIDLIEAFQRENWPRTIPNPLRDDQGKLDPRKLDKAVADMNKNLKKLRRPTILFRRDGTGEGVNWGPAS
jgi:hypothetical protein